jgi:hypothetical protein
MNSRARQNANENPAASSTVSERARARLCARVRLWRARRAARLPHEECCCVRVS